MEGYIVNFGRFSFYRDYSVMNEFLHEMFSVDVFNSSRSGSRPKRHWSDDVKDWTGLKSKR